MAEIISSAVIPAVLLITSFFMMSSREDYFSVFIKGAKEGLRCGVGLIPTMVILCVALGMFRASGAAEGICEFLAPLGEIIGIPSGLFTLIITRPLSGGAANATFVDIVSKFGADSFEAFAGAIIMGSSDTLVYIICVYFSAVRARGTGYAFPAAWAVAILSLFVSLCVARMFW